MAIDQSSLPFQAARYLLRETSDPDGSARQLLQLLNSGQVFAHRLFTHTEEDRIDGALLAYQQEPRFAVVWRPIAESDSIADELTRL